MWDVEEWRKRSALICHYPCFRFSYLVYNSDCFLYTKSLALNAAHLKLHHRCFFVLPEFPGTSQVWWRLLVSGRSREDRNRCF